jgi:hypothetical protein
VVAGCSPTILRFDWAAPGEAYGGDHVEEETSIYLRSAKMADRADAAVRKRQLGGRSTTTGTILDTLDGIQAARQARIQISVIPQVRRFHPVYASSKHE